MTATAEIDGRLKEMKGRWEALNSENDQIVASAKTTNGVLVIDNERQASFRRNLGEMKSIKETMSLLEEQKTMAEWGSQPTRESAALAAAAGGAPQGPRGMGRKSLGQMFTESEEFKALQRSGSGTMAAPWTVEGVDLGAKALWTPGNLARKDVYDSEPTASRYGGPQWGFDPLYRDDIVVQAFRKVRVRDLFPVQPTTAAVIEYFRVTGFVTDNNASVVPQWTAGNSNFGLIPHTNLTFKGVQAPVRTIAHWEAAHRHVLTDVPQLQGIIDTELLYGLRLAEDNQLLNGTGNTDTVLGLMKTTAVQTYVAKTGGSSGDRSGSGSGLTTDTKADDVRRAATKSILAYYEPTGVVMNPSDWESIETIKDSTNAYVVAIAVAVGGQQRLWRLPVVDTPAMTQGRFLVGAFGLGATLYDREEGTIRIAEQHSDFFLRNAIVVMAEERIALGIKRPESFVAGTFGA